MVYNEKKPFFSVVIPLFNKKNYIKDTIETVLNQSFQDFEIVIVNDGSKDESVKIVESIKDSRIRLIHQENAGVSVARNRGIKEAKAEYIAFLDADDLWLPEYLKTIYNLIHKYPEAGLYATAYEMQSENKTRKLKIKGLPNENFEGIIPNYFKSILKGDYLVWTSTVCISRRIFIDSNIWFPPGETRGEDQYVWARIALEFDIAYNTQICAIYKLYTENSTSGSKPTYHKPRKFLLDLNKYKSIKTNKELNIWLDKYLDREIFNSIKLNIFRSNKKLAFNQIFQYKLSLFIKLKLLFLLLLSDKSKTIIKNIYSNFKR